MNYASFIRFFYVEVIFAPKDWELFIYLYKIQVNSRQFVLRKPDLQFFSRFSFTIEVQREGMRKIIMIKVILVIFWVAHSKCDDKKLIPDKKEGVSKIHIRLLHTLISTIECRYGDLWLRFKIWLLTNT